MNAGYHSRPRDPPLRTPHIGTLVQTTVPGRCETTSTTRYLSKDNHCCRSLLAIIENMKITPTKIPRRGKREIVITPEKGDTEAQLNAVAARYPGKIAKHTVDYKGRREIQQVVIYMDEPLFNEHFEFSHVEKDTWATCNHCHEKNGSNQNERSSKGLPGMAAEVLNPIEIRRESSVPPTKRSRRRMNAAARKRIAEAQTKRWAAYRKKKAA